MFYSYLMFVILISDLNIFFYLNEEAGNNYPCHHSLSNKLTTLCNEAFLISMNHPLLKNTDGLNYQQDARFQLLPTS